MNGNGVGYLAVHILQNMQRKEVFRIVGNQGRGWKNASVPLSVLDSTGSQFKVSFDNLNLSSVFYIIYEVEFCSIKLDPMEEIALLIVSSSIRLQVPIESRPDSGNDLTELSLFSSLSFAKATVY